MGSAPPPRVALVSAPMDNQSTATEAAERTRARRPYQAPAVVDFGEVEKLTQSVSTD